MRIAIDARFFGTGTGIGRYIEQLILNLEKIDFNNEYFILINKENEIKYQPRESNFKKKIVNIPWYGIEEQIKLVKILNKLNVDLVHFPHFNVPFFYNKPFIVSIHDLILTRYPSMRATTLSPIKYFFKNIFYKIIINHAVNKSQAVITMANFTKEEIVKKFKCQSSQLKAGPPQAEKVKVIYEGVTKLKVNKDLNSEILFKKYGINKNFVLYVGNAYPHKNLEFLIEAFKNFNKDYELVLVGKKDYFYERLEKFIKNLKIKDKVVLTGYLTDDELAVFYNKAKAYVFPSLCEGFGLPPLEAMNFKLPVLSSNYSCLPEILGDSALYFNPKDKDDFIEKLDNILENESLRNKLIENSEKILNKYSWRKMAENILKIYLSYKL